MKFLTQLLCVCLLQMGGRNTVLLDALSWRIPLVSDIPTIIFGADVTHPETGEDTSPSIAAVINEEATLLSFWLMLKFASLTLQFSDFVLISGCCISRLA